VPAPTVISPATISTATGSSQISTITIPPVSTVNQYLGISRGILVVVTNSTDAEIFTLNNNNLYKDSTFFGPLKVFVTRGYANVPMGAALISDAGFSGIMSDTFTKDATAASNLLFTNTQFDPSTAATLCTFPKDNGVYITKSGTGAQLNTVVPCTPISIPLITAKRSASSTCAFTATPPTATDTNDLSSSFGGNFTLDITNTSNPSQSFGSVSVNSGTGQLTDDRLDTNNFNSPAVFQITNSGQLIHIDQDDSQNDQPFAFGDETLSVGPTITLLSYANGHDASYEFFIDELSGNSLVSQKKETCVRRVFCLSNNGTQDYYGGGNPSGYRIRVYDTLREAVTAGYSCTPVILTAKALSG